MNVLLKLYCSTGLTVAIEQNSSTADLVESLAMTFAHELAVTPLGATASDVDVVTLPYLHIYNGASVLIEIIGDFNVAQEDVCFQAVAKAWRRNAKKLKAIFSGDWSAKVVFLRTGRVGGVIDETGELAQ